jgi:hypothetical protein
MKWLDDLTEKLKAYGDRLESRVGRSPRRKPASTIDELLAEETPPEWTEAEICAWVESLPAKDRAKVIDNTKKIIKAGVEALPYLRRTRVAHENEQCMAADNSGSDYSLLDLWWDWNMGCVYADLFAGKSKQRD